jgi:hypothetical protein
MRPSDKLIIIFFLVAAIVSGCTYTKVTPTPHLLPIITDIQLPTSTPLPKSVGITIAETKSIQLTVTAKLENTIVPDIIEPQKENMVILFDFSGEYIEDIHTGQGRYLITEEGTGVEDVYEWVDTGCTLIVRLQNFDIAEVGLDGEIKQIIFSNNMIPERSGDTSFGVLSPDREWVYYKIGSGNLEQRGDDLEPFRFEFENVETISVDGTEGPFRLSQRGEARTIAWSPDGQQLAFSDNDENGNHQVFVASRDGSTRTQLTFNTRPMNVMDILWSPNGENIAVVIDKDGNESVDLTMVLELTDGTIQVFDNVLAQWWRDNNSLVARQQIRRALGYQNIIILDVATGRTSTFFSGGCYRINPFGNPAKVGCLTIDNEFWVYNTRTYSAEKYSQFVNPLNDLQHWIAAPDGFPGEVACKNLP